MKLDLGIVQFELPEADPLLPTLVMAMGNVDEQEKMSVGPTLAKAQNHKFRRMITVTMSPIQEGDTQDQALDRAMNELVTKMGGTVSAAEDQAVGGERGRIAKMTSKGMHDTPLRLLAAVRVTDGWTQTFVLSSLDVKKNEKAVREQFDQVVASIARGSRFA